MEILKRFYNDYICLNLSSYENIGLNFEINKLITFLAIGLIIAAFGIHRHQTNIYLLFKKLIRTDAIGESRAISLSDLKLASHKPVRRLATNREGALRRCLMIAYDNETASMGAAEGLGANEASEAEAESKSVTSESAAVTTIENKPPSDSTNSETEGKAQANTKDESASSSEKSKYYAVPVAQDGLISPDAKLYIPEEKRDFAEHLLSSCETSLPKFLITVGLIVGLYAALIFTMPLILSGIDSMLAK